MNRYVHLAEELKPLILLPNIFILAAKVGARAAAIGAGLFFVIGLVWAYLKHKKYKFYYAVILSGIAAFSFPLAFLVFDLSAIAKMKKAKLGGTRFAAFGFILDAYLLPAVYFTKPLSSRGLIAASVASLIFLGGLAYRFRPIRLDPTRFASKALREEVISRYGNHCMRCGASGDSLGVEIQIDHIVPWSKGGQTVLNNLQPLCSRCNKEKSDN